jgi:hypothetical protein
MSQVFDILRHLAALRINPLGPVIMAALLAALLEQRWRRRNTPFFSQTHLEAAPPPEQPRDRKAR